MRRGGLLGPGSPPLWLRHVLDTQPATVTDPRGRRPGHLPAGRPGGKAGPQRASGPEPRLRRPGVCVRPLRGRVGAGAACPLVFRDNVLFRRVQVHSGGSWETLSQRAAHRHSWTVELSTRLGICEVPVVQGDTVASTHGGHLGASLRGEPRCGGHVSRDVTAPTELLLTPGFPSRQTRAGHWSLWVSDRPFPGLMGIYMPRMETKRKISIFLSRKPETPERPVRWPERGAASPLPSPWSLRTSSR